MLMAKHGRLRNQFGVHRMLAQGYEYEVAYLARQGQQYSSCDWPSTMNVSIMHRSRSGTAHGDGERQKRSRDRDNERSVTSEMCIVRVF